MQAIFEKVPLRNDESFACREFRGKRFNAPWHVHPEYELTLIEKGEGMRLVGDSVEHFEAGDLVLVGAGLPHCWTNPSPPPDHAAHAMVVQFSLSFLGADFFSLPELWPVRTLLARAMRGLSFGALVRSAVARQMRQLLRAPTSFRVVTLLAILGELSAANDSRQLSSPNYRPTEPKEPSTRIERVYRFLLREYTRELELRDVASVARMSPGAFCRYFRKTSGKTLTELINELRVGHACRMLIDSDATAAEACYASGYGNLSHFNRQFLRIVGCTPSAYRQKYALAAGNRAMVKPVPAKVKLVVAHEG